jgi:REP element-mobilizing transposase RayT
MIVDRIEFLASVFNIDVCAYAIMSNHYHLVLKINSTKNWSEKQVLTYWSSLCQLPSLCERYLTGDTFSKAELELIYSQANIYRKRLMSISWFMKLLNEYISRISNAEEKLTGAFWESRFKSQALLDERALLTCMAYVDLNPIRAAIAKTPEESDHTSIQKRIISKNGSFLIDLGIHDSGIAFTLNDYLELVDATGRAIREDKKGFINNNMPPILSRLGLDDVTWLQEINQFKIKGKKAIGAIEKLKQYVKNIKQKIKSDVGLRPALE